MKQVEKTTLKNMKNTNDIISKHDLDRHIFITVHPPEIHIFSMTRGTDRKTEHPTENPTKTISTNSPSLRS